MRLYRKHLEWDKKYPDDFKNFWEPLKKQIKTIFSDGDYVVIFGFGRPGPRDDALSASRGRHIRRPAPGTAPSAKSPGRHRAADRALRIDCTIPFAFNGKG